MRERQQRGTELLHGDSLLKRTLLSVSIRYSFLLIRPNFDMIIHVHVVPGHVVKRWRRPSLFGRLCWFYLPLILYALGVDCPRFTFHRPPIFLHFVNRFTAEFQRRGITWESLQESGDVDGDFHLTAAKQEELIDMLPGLTLEIAQYVYDLQRQ
jgi:hypothetical protein